MNQPFLAPRGQRRLMRWLSHMFQLLTLLVIALGPVAPFLAPTANAAAPAAPPAAPPAQAAPFVLTLSAKDAQTSAPVDDYRYLLVVDNTGDPTQERVPACDASDPDYPANCDWPSLREVPGAAPIVTQGTNADFDSGGFELDPGKYLISVLARGYKIDGEHFTVTESGEFIVEGELVTDSIQVLMQPTPLDPATMRIKVFHDISPVNGQFDAPAEQGLEGFKVVINDIGGEVTVDLFGNPLCTTYDANGEPEPPAVQSQSCLYSDANGDIVVPNLGPMRYDVVVVQPDGAPWYETTTLEGSWSWDTWLHERGTGLDNEFVVAGEPFPWTVFGFVQDTDLLTDTNVTGAIEGKLRAASVYVPQQGGLPWVGDIWAGFNGAKLTGPIEDGLVAVSDLQNGDTVVYVGPADPDGHFRIENVPDGNYTVTWWDYNLHTIMDWMQVTVSNGQTYDMGTPYLTGWFTKFDGYVFEDQNSNGIKDPGEPGIGNYLVVLRDRDNSEIDRMSIFAVTGPDGYYVLEKAYPMGSWMVLEAYNDAYYTTGITYQVDNQPTPTTVLGNGVDVGVLPILGQPGRLDWGVRRYDATGATNGIEPRNGGIVGTVSYDTTRNELDPRYAAVEGWQPGIPDLTVNLWEPVKCGTNERAPCDARNQYEYDTDGSYKKGKLLNSVLTEVWEQPTDCIARDANGVQLPWGAPNQEVLPQNSDGKRCVEAPVTGTQIQAGFATLDGNYGFGDGCFGAGGFDAINQVCADMVDDGNGNLVPMEPQALPAGDYLVEIVTPVDQIFGRPLYQVVREEDINVFDGDEFVPAVPPPACAGALHTVDVEGVATDGYPGNTLANGVSVPASTPVFNPNYAAGADPDLGGAPTVNPYEGQQRPLCDVKLVTLNNGKSIAPTFNFFTEVPIPGKWKGYIIDDLTVSTDPKSLNFGEKAGIPNSPIGIYDFDQRLITTIQSDPNGVFEVLLPSTYNIACPTPSGVCPNVYYMLGNDPGQPEKANPNYDPQYRTIGASFEIYPGLVIPSDLAPTQIVPGVLAAGSLYGSPPQCALDATTPQIFRVSQPYHNVRPNATTYVAGQITITGLGFGASTGQVKLDDTVMATTAWSDTSITFQVPETTAKGRYQLSVTSATGAKTVNGLTFHVIGVGPGYNPRLIEVPSNNFPTIQAAIDRAAEATVVTRPQLIVVYPDAPETWNPTGAYFENLLFHSPVLLQGVGPGGVYADGTVVPGTSIDGRGVAGDTPYAAEWVNTIQGLTWAGNQAIYPGPVIYVLADEADGVLEFEQRPAIIDGIRIQGGDQQGFPQNLTPGDPSQKEVAAVQGGGIFVNGYASNLQITNNILESNGGAYGGAIRVGTPHLTGQFSDAQNDNMRIEHNRILANGGTNLAGAVAIFSGAENYSLAYNDICGNFSAEYGGGISHYGMSSGGQIHNNRVYFNRSYDEGGGIMIAGELPADPATLSPGAGPVDIYDNLIQNNLGNDDGGGLRFLMAGNFPYNVYNNIIVNNISTHEGGGVALNDTPDVRFFNNTVMKNLTTATAMTSNGQAAPAGFSTSRNSNLLQGTLSGGSPIFSNPLLFNNLFWDNRAGSFTGAQVAGIGLAGDPTPVNSWDLGVADGSGLLAPTNSLLQSTNGTILDGSNVVGANPNVVAEYDTSVQVQPWRGNPRFVDILMVTALADANVLGDYHITTGSLAADMGAAAKGAITAPDEDIDGDQRPTGAGYDAGADELAGAVVAFPRTDVLDAFPDAPLNANWVGQRGRFSVNAPTLEVDAPANQRATIYWSATRFGPNQEAYFTFLGNPNEDNGYREQSVILKLNGGRANQARASFIQVLYDSANSNVDIFTHTQAQGWVLQKRFTGVTFGNGDQLGARALADGTVSAYKNGVLIGNVNVTSGANPWPQSLAASGGYIGLFFQAGSEQRTAAITDFGGGTMPGFSLVGVAVGPDSALGGDFSAQGEEIEAKPAEINSIFLPLVTK